MYQRLLRDTRFFELLLRLDEEHARRVQEAGCSCGGQLHRAHYWRKPRGGPEGLCREASLRHSFCCSQERCRRRRTPEALRFQERKVFFRVVVVLVPVLREGPSPRRLKRLSEEFEVSVRTVRRWQRWWLEIFAQSPTMTRVRGLFPTPIETKELPGSLVRACGHTGDLGERIVSVLRVLTLEDVVLAR